MRHWMAFGFNPEWNGMEREHIWQSLTTTDGDDDDDGGEIYVYVVQEIKRIQYCYIAPNSSHKWFVKE